MSTISTSSNASDESRASPPEMTPEQLAEERSHWLPRILEQNPDLLSLRERTLPWTGGYSFANIIHTAMTASSTPINRHSILQLIVNHLNAIGMKKTADTITKETGHKFQLFEQPWEKTDLLILLSLGLLPREDPWNIPKDPLVQFIEEPFEEDFFASPYKENPKLLYQEIENPDFNVTFIDPKEPKNFQNLATASLKRLVICLTISTAQYQLNEEDYSQFFLSLHSITSSQHFLEHLITLFDLDFDDEAAAKKLQPNQKEIRISVINLIQKWINFHGMFIGKKTLGLISQFIRRIIDEAKDLVESKDFLNSILDNMENLSVSKKEDDNLPLETPIIKDPQVLFRPNLTIIEPEPLEVARQITLLSHSTFKSVHSREFMEALMTKKPTLQTPTLSEFFDFMNNLSKIILETIIFSNDCNSAFSKVLEICQSLEQLCNFQALSAILTELTRDEVLVVVEATKEQIEIVNSLYSKCGNNSANFDSYLANVKSRYDKKEPAIPNISQELKIGDFKKSPDFINNLINYQKRRQMAEKASIFYQFQNKPYPFFPIQQIQKVIKKGPIFKNKELENRIVELWRNIKKLQ